MSIPPMCHCKMGDENPKYTIAIPFRMKLSPEEDITRILKIFLSGRTKFAIPLSRN